MNTTMQTLIHEAMTAAAHTSEARAKLEGTKEGCYSTLFKAAQLAASAAEFKAGCEAEEATVRTTGIEGMTLERNKTGDQFLIPSSFRTAKSVLLGAIEKGCDVAGAESFGAVRDALKEAKETEKAAAAPKPEAGESFTLPGDGLGLTLGLLIRACAKLTDPRDREQAERKLQAFVDAVHTQVEKREQAAQQETEAATSDDAATANAAALIEAVAETVTKGKGKGRKAG
jgi:hypothetical protein